MVFWFKSYRSLFPRSYWQQASISSDNGVAPSRRQAIMWTNDGIYYWPIYASFRLNELSRVWVGIKTWLDDLNHRAGDFDCKSILLETSTYCSNAVEVPVKFKSDKIIITPSLAASKLRVVLAVGRLPTWCMEALNNLLEYSECSIALQSCFQTSDLCMNVWLINVFPCISIE